MNLQLNQIAEAVKGSLAGAAEIMAKGYSIDTRTLNAGDLFFAVKGPRFDGHDFIQQAIEKKAAGVVIERGAIQPAAGFGVVRVNSTVDALQDLARAVRRQWGGPIVGVTGSAGKTTTKEMVAAVLSRRFTVLRSVGNLNNEFGLPLCLLRVERAQTMAVLEMGMSAAGEILKLASIAEPNEGVITNVNPVHLEFFDSIEGIAAAKAELLQGLVGDRVGYLNYDDPRVRAMAGKFTGKVVSYGLEADAMFKGQNIRDLGLDGTSFTVHTADLDQDFCAAAARTAQRHKCPRRNRRRDFPQHSVERRPRRSCFHEAGEEAGEVVKFQEGFAVIDDSYNSNPKALTEMIRFLGRLQGYSRKIVVAGEMLELGPASAELHRECGKEAAAAGAAFVIGVQGEARSILEGARDAGIAADQLKFADDSAEAGKMLSNVVRKGDVVLVKGSRGVRLEQVLNALRSSFSSREA
jgi:UDP-N-acetylmuramoyl-tripeptide--D-alanyl-D-alanine ligase